MKNSNILVTLLVLLCLVSGSNVSYAQKLRGEEMVDSLLKEVEGKPDTVTADIYYRIGREYHSTGNYKDAVKYHLKALKIYEEYSMQRKIAWDLHDIGNAYFYQSDYEQARTYYDQSVEMAKQIGDSSVLANSIARLGAICQEQSDHACALEHYYNSLRIAEARNDSSNIASALYGIGSIYMSQNNIEKSRSYFEKAFDWYRAQNFKQGIAAASINMGMLDAREHKTEEALKNYKLALEAATEVGDKYNVSYAVVSIAGIYLENRAYKDALEYFERALELNRELGNKLGISNSYQGISTVYLSVARDEESNGGLNITSREALKKAIEYADKTAQMAGENGNVDMLLVAYGNLYAAQRMLGNYKESIENFEKYVQLKDSIYSLDNARKLANLNNQRELDVKDKEIEIQKLEVAKKRNEQFYFIGGIILLVIIVGVVYRNYHMRGVSNKKLEVEKQKSEELLHNILPEEVASELKERGATTAHHFDRVTVMFTDFVDFTIMGEQMGGEALVEELHNCFKAFDGIMDKHGIEKIKTIGDAYMAVCGLPVPDEQHAEKMVRAAVELKTFMNHRREELGAKTFEVRIGIHSGDVVAGIVGVKKFAYDIWGDTVNTAARMEQKSEPGKINISQTTYELVKDKFTCNYRGEIEAKNKGMLKMYFVEA